MPPTSLKLGRGSCMQRTGVPHRNGLRGGAQGNIVRTAVGTLGTGPAGLRRALGLGREDGVARHCSSGAPGQERLSHRPGRACPCDRRLRPPYLWQRRPEPELQSNIISCIFFHRVAYLSFRFEMSMPASSLHFLSAQRFLLNSILASISQWCLHVVAWCNRSGLVAFYPCGPPRSQEWC